MALAELRLEFFDFQVSLLQLVAQPACASNNSKGTRTNRALRQHQKRVQLERAGVGTDKVKGDNKLK